MTGEGVCTKADIVKGLCTTTDIPGEGVFTAIGLPVVGQGLIVVNTEVKSAQVSSLNIL
jgi:hypothetical protein